MPNTDKDTQRQTKKASTQVTSIDLIGELHKCRSELSTLNEKYGGGVSLLAKKQEFECPKCGYHEEFGLHEKILNGEYGIEVTQMTRVQDCQPLYSYILYSLTFMVRCKCPKYNKVSCNITATHALKVLREQRDLVEEGKKPPYAGMIV